MRVLTLVALFAVAYAKHEQYQGWKSYYVRPSDQTQLRSLTSIVQKYKLDFISKASVGRNAVVLVKPQYNDVFLRELADQTIAYTVHVNDVKAQLDIEDAQLEARKSITKDEDSTSIFDRYLELEEIDAYLADIAKKNPDLVTLQNGTSFEGRPINLLKISKPSDDETEKPIIIIDAGIHSREWIGPSTALYAISKLVDEAIEQDLIDELDWVILPMVNPDGYKYSRTTDPLWVKTRSTDNDEKSVECPGADANSNFDFYWNLFGTSSDPCDDNYAGSKVHSEVEVQYGQQNLEEFGYRTVLYISLHSYGSQILYSWGHDGTLSQQAFALQTVGISIANAIQQNAKPNYPRYIVGNSALVTGQQTSGSTVDYLHYNGIPLTYNLVLPGVLDNTRGFNPDPTEIEQIAKETWAGIVVGARRAKDLFGNWIK
ncbi:PREDICTED: carboxypeptidase B-like [Papilio polytes]|uniref:carboxypeptidase B-like n=1 Tax=Papilio polytes TaxID=76194 RepID=UPI000676640A|nr:PREDICTED: carboxypeptidase B-like [Papilio polytes]